MAGGARHEQLVQQYVDKGYSTRGFYKALADATVTCELGMPVSDVLTKVERRVRPVWEDNGIWTPRDAWWEAYDSLTKGLFNPVPDAFKIDLEARVVDIVEVEDTNPLSSDKTWAYWRKLDGDAHLLGRLICVSRYGDEHEVWGVDSFSPPD